MRTYNIFIILLVAAATMIACNSNKKEDVHELQHEEKLHLTSYSPDFEVYVIATPFVAGEVSHVLTHITLIENFKPLTKASVIATLSSGNVSVTEVISESSKPGIYEFEIKPADEGTGTLSFEIETDSGVSIVTIQPIEVYGDTHEAYQAASNANVSGRNSVTFLKEQSWKINFSTEEVEKELLGQIIHSTGQIMNTPNDVHVISSAMSGIVQLSGNSLFEGSEIKPGQQLFRIDGSVMAENNLSVRFAEAESEFNRAKAEYERKEKLAAEHIVSESELNQALSEYKIAEANYNNLKNNFASGSQSVTSPVSGYLKELLVENGEYVDIGDPVLSISQNSRLIIQTKLQPKYIDILDNISSVNFRAVNGNHTYSPGDTGEQIISYSRSVDQNNPLITLTIQLESGTKLLPGSFVEIFMKTEGKLPVITVPNESIVEEMGNYFVYVQLTPELFEKRLIVKGATDGRRTEIKEGVLVGERVVGKGSVFVKLSQSAGSVDVHSGHVH